MPAPAENDRFAPPEEGFDLGVFAVAGADDLPLDDDILGHALAIARKEYRPYVPVYEQLAAKGLDVLQMMAMFGWAQASTARAYIANSPDQLDRQLQFLLS